MSIGRALDRAELADVMARADALYSRWAEVLRCTDFAHWFALLEQEPELNALPVEATDVDAYRLLIVCDLDRLLNPPSDEGEAR